MNALEPMITAVRNCVLLTIQKLEEEHSLPSVIAVNTAMEELEISTEAMDILLEGKIEELCMYIDNSFVENAKYFVSNIMSEYQFDPFASLDEMVSFGFDEMSSERSSLFFEGHLMEDARILN